MTSRYKVTIRTAWGTSSHILNADAYVSTKDGDFTRFTDKNNVRVNTGIVYRF